MPQDDEVELYGRRFTFRFTTLAGASRVDVRILEGTGAQARPYIRAPVRARTAAEARERAWEVLRSHAGLDRYLGLVARVAADVAPGSRLVIAEDAQMIRVDLAGPRRLQSPLALVREDALDPERTDEELLTYIRTHLQRHLEDSA